MSQPQLPNICYTGQAGTTEIIFLSQTKGAQLAEHLNAIFFFNIHFKTFPCDKKQF